MHSRIHWPEGVCWQPHGPGGMCKLMSLLSAAQCKHTKVCYTNELVVGESNSCNSL